MVGVSLSFGGFGIFSNSSILCLFLWLWCHQFDTPFGFAPVIHTIRRSVYPLSASSLQVSDDNNNNVVVADEGLIRYRGRVAYDGSKFHGFQIQLGRDARTIQDSLEEVLRKRFQRTSLRVVGAGRTDAGVSARGQAFHFDLTQKEHEQLYQPKQQQNQTPPSLAHVMNRMLLTDDEIRVWNVSVAPAKLKKLTLDVGDDEVDDATPGYRWIAWNAIYDATHKLYSYRISLSVMDPINRFHRWQVPGDGDPVDVSLLEQTLKRFEGTHDFRAFAGAVEQAEKKGNRIVNSVRTIYQCNLVDESEDYNGREGYYRIDIVLSGALYKMVRNIVGTAIDVSRGRVDDATFSSLLHGGGAAEGKLNRNDNKSKPAPPEGLTLEWVFYDDDDGF